ncbi:unnamed protein product, partial [Polarella glacialis]
VGLASVLRLHWRSLSGAGVYCALLSGCRNTWMIALPLTAHSIGLSKVGIGLTVAAGRAIEACVTLLAAGQIMDKYGRKAAGLPANIMMAGAFGLLALTKASGFLTLVLAVMLWGVANGLCGGIIVSFATDLTPESCRSEFLGLWKTVQAVGGLVLPPFFGVVS